MLQARALNSSGARLPPVGEEGVGKHFRTRSDNSTNIESSPEGDAGIKCGRDPADKGEVRRSMSGRLHREAHGASSSVWPS